MSPVFHTCPSRLESSWRHSASSELLRRSARNGERSLQSTPTRVVVFPPNKCADDPTVPTTVSFIHLTTDWTSDSAHADLRRSGDESVPLVLSRSNKKVDKQPKSFFIQITSQSSVSSSAIMITTREVDPCESKMLQAKMIQSVSIVRNTSNCDSSEIDKMSRKELVRRGAVGRRSAVVALPSDVVAALAELSELKW
ncbi:hypothetical protein GN244_ATG20051 [Phytophthora infestans]|uniref:Uncharacterized protein n=1 Tax=Phytophthora infestans TaxID=4787 RepID=A0A833SHQ3_PHYIN|nr:hypothetical protein GN244_ATG20051 [Phytophthora infestans]